MSGLEKFPTYFRHNLNNGILAPEKDRQPAAPETSTMSLTYRNVVGARRSLAFPSIRTIRAQTVRALSVSLDIPLREFSIDMKMFLQNFAAILRSLPALKELNITGHDNLLFVAQDIFHECSFTLEKLHCTVDKLLAASWSSLRHHSVRDFRGFLNVIEGPPSAIRPDDMANLERLETSASFAKRLTNPAKITHLSLHTSRSLTKETLSHLSDLLGEQLVSLRVNRTLAEWKSPPAEEVEKADADELLWKSDSPLMICSMLRAPNLRYLEIRDTSLKKWTVNAHTVRDVPWVWDTVGTPALERLVWRPACAKRVRQLDTITTEHARDCFALLPVDFVAISSEDSEQGVWRVLLRGTGPQEFEEHWSPCAIREDSWRI